MGEKWKKGKLQRSSLTGFGFAVKSLNVPMIKVRGVWTPNIRYKELSITLLHALSHKTSRLTGNQVRFIRTYFEMTLEAFAKRFCVSHVAVLKWEKAGNKATAMGWSTEKDIRLFVVSRLHAKPRMLAELYADLEAFPLTKPSAINIDAKDLAA